MIIKKTILSIGALISISMPVSVVLSCTSENPTYIGGSKSVQNRINKNYELNTIKSSFGIDYILKDTSYNDLYDEMIKIPNTVAMAVIANHKIYTDIVKIKKGETIIQALDSSRFIFKRYMHKELGAFINSFALRKNQNVFMHGTRTEKNYGDFYPLYYINHKFAQLGVSNFHLTGHEMLEISYDDK